MAPADPIRAAFHAATGHFVDAVGKIPADRWEWPGLGDWSIRSLVGHTSRSLLTVETYLAMGADHVAIQDAVEYFVAALASTADESAITERGRQAGIALGDDPAEAVQIIAARVLPVVDRAPDVALVGTPWGGMRIIDYLPTRVFELTIHTLDLGAALGSVDPAPDDAATVTWAVIGALARRRGSETHLLRAATGRYDLPHGFSILRP